MQETFEAHVVWGEAARAYEQLDKSSEEYQRGLKRAHDAYYNFLILGLDNPDYLSYCHNSRSPCRGGTLCAPGAGGGGDGGRGEGGVRREGGGDLREGEGGKG